MRSARRLVPLAVVGLLCIPLAACGSASGGAGSGSTASVAPHTGPAAVTASDLDGRSYVSTTVTGHDLVHGTTIGLSFSDGRMVARAGCNTMSGPFGVGDGSLRWTGDVATTMMGCEPDRAAQDSWLSDLLTKGVAATGTADALTLTSGSLTIELAREAPADAASLLGTAWTVTGTSDGTTASTVPDGMRTPAVAIAADGAVTIDTGCNTGRSKAVASGSTLTFAPPAVTRKACPSDAASAVETAILKTLDGAVEVSGEGSSVVLTGRDHGLTLTRKS